MRRVVLDQGLPATAAAILRDGGWDAVHVREIAMKEATDGEILDYAAPRVARGYHAGSRLPSDPGADSGCSPFPLFSSAGSD